jgi:Na+/proline symporter
MDGREMVISFLVCAVVAAATIAAGRLLGWSEEAMSGGILFGAAAAFVVVDLWMRPIRRSQLRRSHRNRS